MPTILQAAKELKARLDKKYEEIDAVIGRLNYRKEKLLQRREKLGSLSVDCDSFIGGSGESEPEPEY